MVLPSTEVTGVEPPKVAAFGEGLARPENAGEAKVSNGLADISALAGPPVFVNGGIRENFSVDSVSRVATLEKSLRADLITNYRVLLSTLYSENGLIQTIIDVPVDDAFKAGIELSSKQISAEDIEDLQTAADEINLIAEVGQAHKWARLFGGGAILIISGGKEPDEPFSYDEIEQDDPVEFRAVEMWELLRDGGGQHQPKMIPGDTTYNSEFFNYYGKKVHRSRVIGIRGKRAPSFLRPRLQGWGLSAVETLVRSINQFLKSQGLTFEVLDEFKVDIFSISGLNQALLSPGGTDQVRKRVQLANEQKNYLRALILDTLDKHESKQIAFAGLAEMIKEFRIQLACDLRFPLTKLFGLSATGFASGEDDIEVYNSMVESEVRSKGRHVFVKVFKVLAKQKLGIVPDDLRVSYQPMRILTADQEEGVKDRQMERVMKAYEKGFLSAKEAMDAINRAKLVPVQLDADKEVEEDLAAEAEEAGPNPFGARDQGEDDGEDQS